ncbi:FG-GAP-like repeat-containing protein [Ruminococcaceae bacterium OttesenSCG-928-D13]|nr:FG-GAP-like repeat-containing protein [Ruminococcaceae bacterium OttesenSCG-928-D13]
MKKTYVRAIALLMTLVLMAALCVPMVAAEPPPEEMPPTGDESVSVPVEERPAPEEAPLPEEATPAEEPLVEEALPEETPPEGEGDEEPEATVLPEGFEVGPKVYAEAEAPEPTAQDDVFSAAGFNLSTPPDGQDERKEMKPYGDAHTLTINEMLVFGSNEAGRENTYGYLEANLYGHDALATTDVKDNDKKSVQLKDSAGGTPTFFNDRSSMAAMEGDFTGEGIKYQVAMLAAEGVSGTGTDELVKGFKLYVMNGVDVARGDTKSLHEIAYFDYTNNRSMGWGAVQGELFVETGDLDGDGRDEIIFLLPASQNANTKPARLMVYRNSGTAGGWKNAANWKEVLSMPVTGVPMYSVKENSTSDGIDFLFANHSLAVGDLDGDGKAEVAVAGSTLKANSRDNSGDTATMQLQLLSAFDFSGAGAATTRTYSYSSGGTSTTPLFGSGGLGLAAPPTAADLKLNDANRVNTMLRASTARVLPTQLGVAIGDVDGGTPELLVGYTLYGSTKVMPMVGSGCFTSSGLGYTVEQLSLNGDKLERVSIGGQPVLRVNMEDIAEATNAASPGHYPQYRGKSVQRLDDTYAYIKNQNNPYGSEGIYSNGMSMRLTAAQMNGPQAPASIIVGTNRHDRTFGANTDPFAFYYTGTQQYTYYPLCDGNNGGTNHIRIYTLRPAVMTSVDEGDNPIPAYGYVIGQRSTGVSGRYGSYVEFISGNTTSNVSDSWGAKVSQRLVAGKLRHIGSVAVALPDTDRDSVTLNYQEYSFMYTDPTVIAALAAPPYYRDIANIHGVDYTSESSTSYSMELGVGSGTTQSETTNLGAYVSVEAEVGTPSVRAVVESEVNYNKQWSTQFSSMMEKSHTYTFESKGQDSVVLLAYPTDVYTYSMTFPVNDVTPGSAATYADAPANDDFAVCDYSVIIPYSPTYSVLSLKEYNRVYKQYTDLLPDIGGEVFTHTEGWPGSYPTSSGGYYGAEVTPGAWVGSGTSTGASTESSLTITSTDESTTTASNSVSFKAGGGVTAGYSGLFVETSVKVTAGVTYGTEESRGTVVSNSSGVTYSGKVGGIPNDVNGVGYKFFWKMMQYQYRGKQNFPVVTYLVQGDQNPVRLPETFEVYDASTTNSMTLRWSPSPDDQNPGADSVINYAVSQVMDNSKDHLPLDMERMSFNEEDGHYYSTITDLQAGKWYNFILKAKPQSSSGYSVPSESAGAMTFPLGGSGGFTQQPKELELKPGQTTGALSAKLNVTDTAGAPRVTGAWQKWNDVTDEWESLAKDSYPGTSISSSPAGDFKLEFTQPAAYHAGTYRLLAYAAFVGIQGEKEFFSQPVEVSYSRWNADMEVVCDDGQDIPDIVISSDLKLRVGMTDIDGAGLGFAGGVQYTLTLPNGSQSIGLVPYPPKGGGKEATITLGTTIQGAYTLQVAYIGDPNYNKVTSKTYNFTRVNPENSIFITATAPAGQVQYGIASPLAVLYYNKTVNPVTVTSNTTFTLYKYNSSGALEQVAPGAGCTFGAGNSSLTVTALGRYQLAVNYAGASIKRDFEVVPLTLNYRINNLTWDKGSEPGVLEIEPLGLPDEAKTLLGGDLYTAADLVVYNEDGELVTNPTAAAGRYAIRVKPERALAVGAKPQYNINVTGGLLTVQLNLKTVTYGTLEGTSAKGGVKLSGETASYAMNSEDIQKGEDVKLIAVPATGYRLDHWLVSVNNGGFRKQQPNSSTPEAFTISKIGQNYIVLAVFTSLDKPDEGTRLAVYPTTPKLAVSAANPAT